MTKETENRTEYTMPDFIVIDDDFINNVICQQVILCEMPGAKVDIYLNANKGFEYINEVYSGQGAKNAVLFLDINMPALNGWDILEMLSESPALQKQQLKIYLLSSSVTPEDKQKADDAALVAGYIEKPLTQAQLQAIFSGHILSKGY